MTIVARYPYAVISNSLLCPGDYKIETDKREKKNIERLSERPRSQKPCAKEDGAEPKDEKPHCSYDYFSIPEADSPKAAH